MSPFDELMQSVVTKLSTCSFITNPSNIIWGETPDLLALPDSAYPRIEILVEKAKANGYYAQRDIQWAFRYDIVGYLRRPTDAVTQSDLSRLVAFATEVFRLNYSFLDDAQNGNPPCTGFLKLDGYPEIFLDTELIPKLSVFGEEMEVHLDSKDINIG